MNSALSRTRNPLKTNKARFSPRPLLGWLHRWIGLITAAFLFVTGITGAVISWDHELDELLNPHLIDARIEGPALPTLELIRAAEQRHPDIQVTFAPLAPEPGHSLAFSVAPRVDPGTGQLFKPGFNQLFIDPASGTELGAREWGAVWPITRETLVSFLYKLHYSLHIPKLWGIDEWGEWLLGGIAILWTLDCFVGAYLTLPVARRHAVAPAANTESKQKTWLARWAKSWKIRWNAGSYKLNFDLHRAVSLWAWGLLFTLAFTAFSLNLYREVFYPLMSTVSKVTPSPFDTRIPAAENQPIAPRLDYADVLVRASAEAQQRGWNKPAGSVFYSPTFGIYAVSFFHPEEGHGAGGVGHARLYFDGLDGRYLGDHQPWQGTAADIFVQAQFPLHSGRILGLPGRILISVMGLVVAMLSVTGVVIWWRKRRARSLAQIRRPYTTIESTSINL